MAVWGAWVRFFLCACVVRAFACVGFVMRRAREYTYIFFEIRPGIQGPQRGQRVQPLTNPAGREYTYIHTYILRQ